MAISVVGDPSQPCGTLTVRTAKAPAAVVDGVMVTWAPAGAATPRTAMPSTAGAAPSRARVRRDKGRDMRAPWVLRMRYDGTGCCGLEPDGLRP